MSKHSSDKLQPAMLLADFVGSVFNGDTMKSVGVPVLAKSYKGALLGLAGSLYKVARMNQTYMIPDGWAAFPLSESCMVNATSLYTNETMLVQMDWSHITDDSGGLF